MHSIVQKILSLRAISNEDQRFFQTQRWMLKKDTRDLCSRSVLAVLSMSINPSLLDVNNPNDFLMRQEADIFTNRFISNPRIDTISIEEAFSRWKRQDVEETKKYVQDRMVFCLLNNLDNAYFKKTLQNMGEDYHFLDHLSFNAVDQNEDLIDSLEAHVTPMPLVKRYIEWRRENLDVLDFLQKIHKSREPNISVLLQMTQ